jgi:hypothetical protein
MGKLCLSFLSPRNADFDFARLKGNPKFIELTPPGVF